MKIQVEFVNQSKKLSIIEPSLTLPAFLKHAAISGQGIDFGILPGLVRGVGLLMFYGRYIDLDWMFHFNKFRKSQLNIYDPTEQSNFSTIVGRAVADFLAKELLEAKYTHSYEAAMYHKGMPIEGSRPDLYCTTKTQQFAIEAKGFSCKTISITDMRKHKIQAQSGPLPVHFSVASVTYNIYDSIRCKFHDPIESDIPFSRNENDALAKQYYQSLFEQLDDYIEPEAYTYKDRSYLAYNLAPYLLIGRKEQSIRLLLDVGIQKNLRRDYILDIEYPRINESNIYLDSDGVGIVIG